MDSSNNTLVSIKQWYADDQPRNKLLTNGLAALSNSELLSILINVGNKDKSALDLAKDVLHLAKNNLSELGKLSINDLQKIKGIGEAKSTLITAALELGKRREISTPLEYVCIRNSHDLANYLKVLLKDYSYEVFGVVFLNRANKIKHFEIISRGGITGTVADPRIILKKAVEQNATAIVLSHNHPSGNLNPSVADQELTNKIKQAASYFDIKVIDHLIISDDGYYSFADEGMI
ncbi:MAG TPA: DNA repair protein RadC [Ferruginibacter sp.]|nr:DNA repair protein RadC [Ferruginibacter sp.]